MHIVVFGSTGFLGTKICENLDEQGYKVSKPVSDSGSSSSLKEEDSVWLEQIARAGGLDGIVWTQGQNSSGTVLSTSISEIESLFEANVVFVVRTMKKLVEAGLINNPCRAVIVGSVWQMLTRNNKLAYLISKSAVGGLVGSIASDMADMGLSINAVLPGVVDSPMARKQLSEHAIRQIEKESLGGNLISAEELSEIVAFLLSSRSSGINGQSIIVDHGWSRFRHVEP